MNTLSFKKPINKDKIIPLKKKIIVHNNKIIEEKTELKLSTEKIVNEINLKYAKIDNISSGPKIVNGDVNLSYTKITSFEGIGKKYCREIKGNLYLYGLDIKSNAMGIIIIRKLKCVKMQDKKVEHILNKYIKQIQKAIKKKKDINPIIKKCKIELNDNGYKNLARF